MKHQDMVLGPKEKAWYIVFVTFGQCGRRDGRCHENKYSPTQPHQILVSLSHGQLPQKCFMVSRLLL